MIKQIIYIIKKVIIGFLIGVLLFLFRSSYSYALTVGPYWLHIKDQNDNTYAASNRIVQYSMVGDNTYYITRPKGTCSTCNSYNTKAMILSFTGVPNDGQEYTIFGTGHISYTIGQGIPNLYIFGTNTRTTSSNIDNIINNAGNPLSLCKVTLSSNAYGGVLDYEYQSSNGNYVYSNEYANTNSVFSYECGGVGNFDYYVLVYYSAVGNNIFGISNRLSFASNKTAEALLEIKEEQEKTTQAIKDMTDTIKSEDSPSDSQYSSLSDNNANNGVINQLITMPITLAQSYLNGFNSSCTPFRLGTLYGEELILPCINPQNYLGAMWSVIDVIISGIFIFVFGKKLVKIFNDVTNLKENQVNEVFD